MATAPPVPSKPIWRKADALLGFSSPKISKERLHLPDPDFVDRIWSISDRSPRVIASLQRMVQHRPP